MDCVAARMSSNEPFASGLKLPCIDSFQPALLFSTLQVHLAPRQSLAANTPPTLASLIFTPRRRSSR
jgi:hypothetical protein